MRRLGTKVIDMITELLQPWRGKNDPTVIAMNRAKQQASAVKNARKHIHREKPAQIVLVRHAESLQNVIGNTRTEETDLPANEHVPITEKGIRQAIAGGNLYKELELGPPDAIYTSGVMRTKMTLAYFAEAAGIAPSVPVLENLSLNEINWGLEDVIPDRTLEKIFPLLRKYNKKREDDRFYHARLMGESQWEHHIRVKSFLDSILRNRSGQKLLIIAHSETIKQLIANIWMNEWTQYRDFNRAFGLENVSMIHLEPNSHNGWELVGWNPKIKNDDFFNDPFPAVQMKDIYARFAISGQNDQD